ncbi:hypothetical protein [Cognatiluteimonas lumbrici]|uniref:hypothetical protein n=1 Tax=Cognatiluteimonas lumbrici TaxID=2559601 RepID=UPI0011299122|nr:hypothetical protein [Luteimonas lumbrici]
MRIPPGFTTGLLIESAPDGQVAVGVARDGLLLGEFTMSPLDIANMAAAMLAASRDAAAELSKGGDGIGESAGAIVSPSSFSIGPGANPEEDALVLSFGESHLAFSMRRETMRQLGESMVAVSNRPRPH